MPENLQPKCVVCSVEMTGSHSHRKYCSRLCKSRYMRVNGGKASDGHNCRWCGKHFPIGPGQNNKWLCSDGCRKKSNAKSVREFHKRRPQQEAIYRARTKEKRYPESDSLERFYIWFPDAPRACESCGESRVLDVAHKPCSKRNGARRNKGNTRWPQDVWILCPTCHALHDLSLIHI